MENVQTVEEAAEDLAATHRQNDPETVAIYRVPAGNEIRLLEVTGSIGPTGDLLPFRFRARPDLGVPYASVIVLASPSEWRDLQAGKLHLPEEFGTMEELERVG